MSETKKQEIWKPYPEYPFVEANQFGEIRTVDRYIKTKNGTRFVKGRVLKQFLNKNGYMQVQLHANGKPVSLYVHRVIAICFIPNPDNLPEINHRDNNRKNNAVSNLEWCTHQYNMAYKNKFGTSPTEIQGRPVIAINFITGEIFRFKSQREAARQLSVNLRSLSYVLKGKRNHTGGYLFCYADLSAIEIVRAKLGDGVANKVKKLISES